MCNVTLYRYRSFPAVTLPLRALEVPRKYMCNFIGTVYENSTRELLLDVLSQSGLVSSGHCFLKTRTQYAVIICYNCNLVLLFIVSFTCIS